MTVGEARPSFRLPTGPKRSIDQSEARNDVPQTVDESHLIGEVLKEKKGL